MKNLIWILVALILSVINGDTALFVSFMKWGLVTGLVLAAAVFAFRLAKTPFAKR